MSELKFILDFMEKAFGIRFAMLVFITLGTSFVSVIGWRTYAVLRQHLDLSRQESLRSCARFGLLFDKLKISRHEVERAEREAGITTPKGFL